MLGKNISYSKGKCQQKSFKFKSRSKSDEYKFNLWDASLAILTLILVLSQVIVILYCLIGL